MNRDTEQRLRCFVQSRGNGHADIAAALDEITTLRGERTVYASALSEALLVLQTIEDDNADEEASLRVLRDRIEALVVHSLGLTRPPQLPSANLAGACS